MKRNFFFIAVWIYICSVLAYISLLLCASSNFYTTKSSLLGFIPVSFSLFAWVLFLIGVFSAGVILYYQLTTFVTVKHAYEQETENIEQSDSTVSQVDKIRQRITALQQEFEKINSSEREKKLAVLLAKEMEACQAAYFVKEQNTLLLKGSFAYHIPESEEVRFDIGEGLVGQVAQSEKLINVQSVPDGYITIFSGLGKASPSHLLIAPLYISSVLHGVIELASFKPFSSEDEDVLKGLTVL